MSAKPTVMKFGGTSVEDGPAIERMARIVSAHERLHPVVVVSAMRGVTDALLSAFRQAANGAAPAAISLLEPHFERHLSVSQNLGATTHAAISEVVETTRQEIAELLTMAAEINSRQDFEGLDKPLGAAVMPEGDRRITNASLYDIVLSYGERLSARLATAVLQRRGLPAQHVDARQCILTDDQHGNAKPLLEETWSQTQAQIEPLLQAKRIPVLGGFIASTRNGQTTTLGRGSSDYTATLVSAALGAREAQIWTDVDGVLTADPRLVKTAGTVPELSYEEAAELARFGAKVMHQSMIQPALEQGISVRICNSRAPDKPGTIISARGRAAAGAIKAIAHQTELTAIKISSTPASVANGFLHAIEKIFTHHQVEIDVVGKSDVGVSLACRETTALPWMVQDLKQLGTVEVKVNQAVISCVGDGLYGAQRRRQRILNLVKNIEPALTWHSASEISIRSLVDTGHLSPVVTRLHRAIFEA